MTYVNLAFSMGVFLGALILAWDSLQWMSGHRRLTYLRKNAIGTAALFIALLTALSTGRDIWKALGQ